MKTQRNMAQMKEQIKTPEKEFNKVEMSNLSDAEFKTLVIRILKELSEDFTKDLFNKNDPGRNVGYTNETKEQFTGNQQQSG